MLKTIKHNSAVAHNCKFNLGAMDLPSMRTKRKIGLEN